MVHLKPKPARKIPPAPDAVKENLYYEVHRLERLPDYRYEVVGNGKFFREGEGASLYYNLCPEGREVLVAAFSQVLLLRGDTITIMRTPGHVMALITSGDHLKGRTDILHSQRVSWERDLLIEYVDGIWDVVLRPNAT
jgi:hypothetical protein